MHGGVQAEIKWFHRRSSRDPRCRHGEIIDEGPVEIDMSAGVSSHCTELQQSMVGREVEC